MAFLKKILKKFRGFLRSFDIFGDPFTFLYKDEDGQSTPFGGFIFIIFATLTALYLIYNFIPFLHEENFSLQYYTMNLEDTEDIKLAEEPIAFGFGLTVNNTNANLSDLFKFRVEFRKNNAPRKTININHCELSDFHNLHDKYLNKVNIEDYYCISHEDLSNNSPEGIWTGTNFSYYMISLESKYLNNETHNQLINDYLVVSDCKLQFYYSDLTIDVDDYRNPISSVLNSMFLQLDPTIIQKRNILFMNYHLSDEDSFLHVIPGGEKSSTKTGLSRIEDYAVYKGLNRVDKKTDDYNIYAKIYIRADNRKVEIYRYYQDFMDFYDETTAIFWTLYYFAILIIPSYDRKKAIHSISKKLFFFEGTKYINTEKMRKIKDILKSNEVVSRNIEIKTKEDEIDENIIYTRNPKTMDVINKEPNKRSKNNNNSERKKDEIVIDYSNYNILEIIASYDIFCKTEKFKNKLNLIEQAENIIDEKLDIIYYLKNMLMFELINKIHLENDEIVNFLSRPIIYYSSPEKKSESNLDENSLKISINTINQNENGELQENNEEKKDKENSKINQSEFYKSSYNLKTTILSKNIKELIQNEHRTQSESKIVDLLEKHLEYIE
jgi:hypothetical protein